MEIDFPDFMLMNFVCMKFMLPNKSFLKLYYLLTKSYYCTYGISRNIGAQGPLQNILDDYSKGKNSLKIDEINLINIINLCWNMYHNRRQKLKMIKSKLVRAVKQVS